jgi:hypothetical protein
MEPTPLLVSVLSRCALGQVQGLGGTAITSVAHPSANLSIFVPFRLLAPMPVVQVWWMQGATAAGNVDVGVYTPDGRLLLSGGSVAQSVAGINTFGKVTLGTPILLLPGAYYLALACSSATATFYHLPGLIAGVASWKMLGCAQVASNMPLADNVTLGTFVGGGTPRVPYFGICSEVVL